MCDSYNSYFGGKVCRSCLTNTEDMKSLHDLYTTELCVADVFTLVTSLKCSGDNDDLPAQMCHECFDELHSSYQFVLKSQESDKTLQAYLYNKKTKEEIVTDNTRNISDITITDCIRSVQTENGTNLIATTLMNNCQNMNDVIEEIQLDIKTELNSFSNDLTVSNKDLSIENGITSMEYQSNDNIYEHSYEPINTPLLIAEMQHDHDQELDFIKHEIDIDDVKIEITNDINFKDSNAINNEPANEQDIAIASENHLQSNQIDLSNEMKNEVDDHFIIDTNKSTTETSAKQKDLEQKLVLIKHEIDIVYVKTEITNDINYDDCNAEPSNDIQHSSKQSMSNIMPTANIEMTSNDHGHVHVLPRIRQHLDIQDETENICIDLAERKYTCGVCNKSFNLKRNLIVHMRRHTGEKPYECKICSKTFSLKSSLVRHTRTHTGENICSATFIENGHLDCHPRTPNEDKQYECNICSKTFSVKSRLVGHTRTHTGEKPYACKICSKTFSDTSCLVRHTRTHTGEKPYVCKICSKGFINSTGLVEHTRTHTGEKPYTCKTCSKTFSVKSRLVAHTRTHTGEKPYVCKICSKAFSDKSCLVRHTRTHTGEKPYACKICSMAFIDSTRLVQHTRTHTGEKPYACNVCSKTFNKKACLVRHTRTHTGMKPYACNVCNKSFKCLKSLKNHMRLHT